MHVSPARPRLAVVSDYAWATGGVEEFVVQLVRGAANAYEVDLVTWAGARAPDGGASSTCVEFGDPRDVVNVLESADAVVVVTSFNVRLLARLAYECLVARPRPCVVVVQTSGPSRAVASVAMQAGWLTALAGRADAVVAVSDEVRLALAGTLDDRLLDRVQVIENASRLSSARRQRSTRRTVGFIGRPAPQKGYQMFERLVREVDDRRLSFVANTVSLPAPRILPGVTYSYGLDDAGLVGWFDAVDVLVAPYLRGDGLPLAVLEALKCGVPVIGFDSPGLGSLLRRHGQTVLPARFEDLLGAVNGWAVGANATTDTNPGLVRSWPGQIDAYLDLVEAARTHERVRCGP